MVIVKKAVAHKVVVARKVANHRRALDECFHVEAIEEETDLIYVDAL
ncbi:MAG: hypothetical protein AOA65_1857 [Candidatus Bathyarchaeota archaeon BA1]|nr:MAG: hypothetical protein AOA65_1857 [Candidatus Bathyarchaeota archaeon BA1]